MVDLEKIQDTLSNLPGTIHVFPLDPSCTSKVIEIEKGIKAALGLEVKNLGLEECLQRQYVFCIVKDKRFRPPPEPTVLLIGDGDMIVGEEIVPSNKEKFKDMEDIIYLSDEFVLYTNKKPKNRECFVMPPVSFPELDDIPGVKNVVSCSPSGPSDMMLRQYHGLIDDPKLASILVGFDAQE